METLRSFRKSQTKRGRGVRAIVGEIVGEGWGGGNSIVGKNPFSAAELSVRSPKENEQSDLRNKSSKPGRVRENEYDRQLENHAGRNRSRPAETPLPTPLNTVPKSLKRGGAQRKAAEGIILHLLKNPVPNKGAKKKRREETSGEKTWGEQLSSWASVGE